jgi:hypothetical protein
MYIVDRYTIGLEIAQCQRNLYSEEPSPQESARRVRALCVGLYAGGHRIRDMFLGDDPQDLISTGDTISLANDRHHGPSLPHSSDHAEHNFVGLLF